MRWGDVCDFGRAGFSPWLLVVGVLEGAKQLCTRIKERKNAAMAIISLPRLRARSGGVGNEWMDG
jgi:hypothetical protein